MQNQITGPESTDPIIKAAVEQVRALLPATAPNRIWRQHELSDAEGRRHAVPLLVLTRNGLWVIDIHTQAGELSGDHDIWIWKNAHHEEIIEAPFKAIEAIARRLREAIQRSGLSSVNVRPLVLLAGHPLRLEPSVLRSDLVGLPQHRVDGLASIQDRLLAHPESRSAIGSQHTSAIVEALHTGGLREIGYQRVVGGYRLGKLVADSDIWQEHAAVALDDPKKRARIRTWVLPKEENPGRQASLKKAAWREANVLKQLGRHPSILSLKDIVDANDDHLPRMVFEDFKDGLPLHQFLRARPLRLEDRLTVLQQIADALDHCHRNEIIHRNLSPDSVLVRERGGIEVRLHRFEGALAQHTELTSFGSRHLTHLNERIYDLYRAPELAKSPDAASELSDLFSLGALAWYLFTDKHPGPSPGKRNAQIRDDNGLRLWSVRDDLDADLDEAIGAATRLTAQDRLDAVGTWITAQLRAERPATVRTWINGITNLFGDTDADDQAPIDPLRANKGDPLGEGLIVEDVLGSGASARVLAVISDGRLSALKVPHDARAERMLQAEAAVLQRIEHDNVVTLDQVITLSDRPCLLMQHAGTDTLADLVRKEGALTLDYVQRLGSDLMQTLTYLHERGITHRDLKPSNLSFTSVGKQTRKLLLFDFSLAALPPQQIQAGTPRWRDPMLTERGVWDPAADLYAAAAVLHFALTGERPIWNERDHKTRIVDSRFDPDLRGALRGFFERALAPKHDARFPDATDMCRAWDDLFAADVTTAPTELIGDIDPRLERARLETPIGALGLSARALNALERAGVADVRDLLGLPQNRISLVRGVGRDTQTELLRTAASLRERLGARDDAALDCVLPNTELLPVPLSALSTLPQDARDALHDAALRNARDLGEASAARVGRLLSRFDIELSTLRAALALHATPIDGVLGEWINTLLKPNPRPTQWEVRVAALFGLTPLEADDAPLGGRTNAQVAGALNVKPSTFRVSFQAARKHWARRDTVSDAVIAAIGSALDRVGPVATLPEIGDALLDAHAPNLRHTAHAQAQAIALARFGTEHESPNAPFTWRLIGRHAWLARKPATLDALQALAATADRMALGANVLPLERAQKELLGARRPALDAWEPEHLVQRAVQASDTAALSPRLELYPRNLPAFRAIELSAAVLPAGLTPAAIKKRVATRYPHAAPLPDRPALDEPLRRIGLRWSAERAQYIRPGLAAQTHTVAEGWRTSIGTQLGLGQRETTLLKADRFHATLQRSVESGRFRVIQVSARQSEAAAQALRRAVPKLEVQALDGLLWQGLQAKVTEEGADLDFILDVDRAGPEGEHWSLFIEAFIKPAADQVVRHLLSEPQRRHPRLLQHAGLLARYGLTDALDRLVQGTENEEGAGIWMLLPSWDDGGKPLLRHPHGDLPIPTFKPAQRLRAPRGWVTRHGAS